MIHNHVVLTILVVIFSLTSGITMASDLSFVQNGRLYKSQVGQGKNTQLNVLADRIVDENKQHQQLLVLENAITGGDKHIGGKLKLINTNKWSSKEVARGVLNARLSPKGNEMVVWNDEDVVTVENLDGDLLQTIGIHCAAPIYSHTGNLIAYMKLADLSDDESHQDLYEHAQGIAVYDLKSNIERLVTFDPEDFAPVGFSEDENKLFFNSTRAYAEDPENHIASLWMVDLISGQVERLTNLSISEIEKGNHTPILNDGAVWSSDRLTAFSATDPEDGTWRYQFTKNGKLVSAIHFLDGDSPRWIEQDRVLANKVLMDGKVNWRTFNLQ
jgi:tricorn protease-like protein